MHISVLTGWFDCSSVKQTSLKDR